jgi:hypothetical protein
LRRTGSELAVAAKSHASRTILAKRIIEMAQKGELDSTVLRNDALEHLHKTSMADEISGRNRSISVPYRWSLAEPQPRCILEGA